MLWLVLVAKALPLQLCEQELSRLYDRVKNTSLIKTWRLQWQRLLSRVYGSDIGDDALFLRHTYLCQFAKLLSYGMCQEW